MKKDSSNDFIVQQARARTHEQVEANARRAVIEIAKVLPSSARKTLMKYGKSRQPSSNSFRTPRENHKESRRAVNYRSEDEGQLCGVPKRSERAGL